MLDVRRLRLLRELARRETIAAVADALMYTASAVSQQLSALEREAGVALLERNGRRVVLTPAGRGLVEHADAIIDRLHHADAELAVARGGPAGPLRIGTFPSAAVSLVPSALTELVDRHADLEPMVEGIDSARVADALRSGELDVALIHDYDFAPATPDPTVESVDLLAEPMYLAAPASAASAPCRNNSLSELISPWRDYPWITAMPGTTGHTMALGACHAAGFEPRIRHHVNEFAAVLSFVAAGQGVALVPQLAASPVPEGVALTQLPMHRRTKVAFRRGAGEHPAVTAFVTAIRTAAAG